MNGGPIYLTPDEARARMGLRPAPDNSWVHLEPESSPWVEALCVVAVLCAFVAVTLCIGWAIA
jgi:hypothetical protein